MSGENEVAKSRLVFIDLLRGWATIVMIEVHVFNAFILEEFKYTSWFKALDFVNGLVAPSFLFVAGFVFVVASDRKLEEFRTFGKAFWRQLARIMMVWLIGYGLHLPFFSLSRTLQESSPEQLAQFYQSDILHCIAIGMLIVFVSRIVIHRDEWYQRFLVFVGSALVLIAPFIWETDFSGSLPGYIAAYLNGKNSMFPLFPWLGFMMFGAVTAFAHRSARLKSAEPRYFRRLMVTGLGLILVGSILIELPVTIPGMSLAVRAHPLFFASRLGIILVLLTLCSLYAEKRRTEASFVLDVSKESLLVYAAHLMVIYGRFWNDHSLTDYYGGTLGILGAVVGTLVLIVVMVVVARVWGWTKQRSFPWARYISYATGATVFLIFLVRKY